MISLIVYGPHLIPSMALEFDLLFASTNICTYCIEYAKCTEYNSRPTKIIVQDSLRCILSGDSSSEDGQDHNHGEPSVESSSETHDCIQDTGTLVDCS